MPEVNCTVNTCKYWTNGNECTAKNIVVQSDDAGGFPPSAKLDQLQQTPAQKKDETCCQTFNNQMR
jgi:hypothetical protein